MTIQMKVTKQYFPVVLFIMLYKVVLTVNEILTYDHSIESRLLSGTFPVYFSLQDGSNLF